MHFLKSTLSLIVPLLAITATSGTAASTPETVCNSSASGKGLQAAQQAAVDDFAHIILELRDPQTAYDKYIPGEYLQHSAGIAQPGRQATLDVLIPLFTAPGVSISHLRTFASNGTGILHYRLNVQGGLEDGGRSLAIVDLFRFEGTCIVEHWDALQQITGQEANPNAFF